MRKIAVMALVAAVGLIAGWVMRGEPVARDRPPAPTAEEEGGMSLPPSPAPGRAPSGHAARDPVDVRPESGPRSAPAESVELRTGTQSVGGVRSRSASVQEGSGPEPQGVGETSIASPGAVPDEAPMLTPPVLLSRDAPAYPSDAYRVTHGGSELVPRLGIAEAQGTVVLKILVRANGSVARAEVAVSAGAAVLDDTAVRAARGWRFLPATRDGIPIDAWVTIPVRFVAP